MDSSIFLDFRLPNAATWFYFSLLLTVALFFQFTRPFSIRNLDLLMLFLLVPGFLLVQEAGALDRSAGGDAVLLASAARERALGYGWLLIGSLYWFVRAVVDLALVRRPAMSANLNTQGLGWLGLALFVCLTAVAVRRTPDQQVQELVGKRPAPIEQVQDTAKAIVQQAQTTNGTPASQADIRFWAERGLAMLCHAAVLTGLVMIGWRHFGDLTAGVGAAALYVLVPYTAYNIGQVHHVWPAAFLVWAPVLLPPAHPGWVFPGSGGRHVGVPRAAVPPLVGVLQPARSGPVGLAFLTATAVSVVTALVLWVAPIGQDLVTALHLTDWKPWSAPQTESIWTGAHWAYRLPVFVLFVAFLVVVSVWPNPKNLGHLFSQSAAVLIGVQFWHADRGGLYVLWYLPLLLLMVFRPNLTAAEPPPIVPGSAFVRLAGAAWRRVRPGPTPTNSKPLAV